MSSVSRLLVATVVGGGLGFAGTGPAAWRQVPWIEMDASLSWPSTDQPALWNFRSSQQGPIDRRLSNLLVTTRERKKTSHSSSPQPARRPLPSLSRRLFRLRPVEPIVPNSSTSSCNSAPTAVRRQLSPDPRPSSAASPGRNVFARRPRGRPGHGDAEPPPPAPCLE